MAKNPRHLLNAPPDDQTTFHIDDWLPVIIGTSTTWQKTNQLYVLTLYLFYMIVALRKDATLRDVRYSLVPNEIDENSFWRNYFFRVNLIKRAYNLSELPQLKEGAPALKPSVLRSSLNSSTSSLGQSDSNDLSNSSTSLPQPKFDEPNLTGLIPPAESKNEKDEPSGNLNNPHQEPSAAEHEFYDLEDTGTRTFFYSVKSSDSNDPLVCWSGLFLFVF